MPAGSEKRGTDLKGPAFGLIISGRFGLPDYRNMPEECDEISAAGAVMRIQAACTLVSAC